jgi:alpha-1,2-mannosyltransferase
VTVTARARLLANLAALLAGAALLALAARQIDRAVGTGVAADLVVDHRAARAFWEGYDPFSPEGARRSGLDEYGATGLGHPPTTSIWMLPLAPLSLDGARAVMGWLSLATLLGSLLGAARLLRLPVGPAVLLAGLVASAPFFTYLVTLGQVSQLIAFTYFLAWWALRRERPALAGAALGAACTMKLFPAVVVLWLLVTRRWRAVLAAIGVYLAAAVVMTARFGLDSWRVFFSAQEEVANAWIANVANQSLHGVVQRLVASPACELPGRVSPVALAISSALSLGLVALAARRVREQPLDLSFASFALLSVLTSQWAWQHYNVLLALPALLLAASLRAAPPELRPLAAAGVAALAALLVTWRMDVRATTVLQLALWRGEQSAHLRLHLAEALAWLPGLLLWLVVARLAARLAHAPARA